VYHDLHGGRHRQLQCLLGMDFLMKTGAIVDVERGLIQVRKGPGTNVEVLPLTMVNLLQKMNS